MVLHIGARADANAGADGRKCDAAAALIIDAQTGDEIDAAFHTGETLQHPLFLAAQLVDQGETFRGIAAEIEAHGRAFPINLLRLGILADQPA